MTPQEQAAKIKKLEYKIDKSVVNIEGLKVVLEKIAYNAKAEPMGRALAAGVLILVEHTDKDGNEKELDHLKRESRFAPLDPPQRPRKKSRKR